VEIKKQLQPLQFHPTKISLFSARKGDARGMANFATLSLKNRFVAAVPQKSICRTAASGRAQFLRKKLIY
jgi:hypothetical protein